MNRRDFLLTSAVSAAFSTPIHAQGARLRRALPRSRESLPAIGMGTWLTFDVGDEAQPRAQRREVLRRFFAAGGGVIDSSPMYGRSEQLLGELLAELPHDGRLFTSTKVWTIFDRVGPRQLEESLRLWRVPRFDLLLVHNLLNWEAHLKTLRVWKEAGRVRYIGVSTSHGRKHAEIQRVMREQPIDAIQITYNLADASALPVLDLAAERGIGVFINRPFDGGMLFNAVGARAVPPWAAEFDCRTWAQFSLKYILANPLLTCVLTETSNPQHMVDNLVTALGPLPDAAARQRMREVIDRV